MDERPFSALLHHIPNHFGAFSKERLHVRAVLVNKRTDALQLHKVGARVDVAVLPRIAPVAEHRDEFPSRKLPVAVEVPEIRGNAGADQRRGLRGEGGTEDDIPLKAHRAVLAPPRQLLPHGAETQRALKPNPHVIREILRRLRHPVAGDVGRRRAADEPGVSVPDLDEV